MSKGLSQFFWLIMFVLALHFPVKWTAQLFNINIAPGPNGEFATGEIVLVVIWGFIFLAIIEWSKKRSKNEKDNK